LFTFDHDIRDHGGIQDIRTLVNLVQTIEVEGDTDIENAILQTLIKIKSYPAVNKYILLLTDCDDDIYGDDLKRKI